MNKSNKLDALNALKKEMSPTEIKIDALPEDKSNIKKTSKPKNVPWYPQSHKLKKELKQLALDEDSSMNALITEGIKLVFEKRGKNFESYI